MEWWIPLISPSENHMWLKERKHWQYSLLTFALFGFLASVATLGQAGGLSEDFGFLKEVFPPTGIPAAKHLGLFLAIGFFQILMFLTWPQAWSRKTSTIFVLTLGVVARLLVFPHPPSDDVNHPVMTAVYPPLFHQMMGLVTVISDSGFVTKLYPLKNSREMRRAPSARTRGMRDAKYGRKILRPSCIPKGGDVQQGACPPLLKSYTKLVFVLFDFGTAILIAMLLSSFRLSPGWLIQYFLHPLILLSFAGEGHQDSAMMFFLLFAIWLAQGKHWRSMFAALGLGFQMKYAIAVCIPFFVSRRNFRSLWVFVMAGLVPLLWPLQVDGPAVFTGSTVFGKAFSFNALVPGLGGKILNNPELANRLSGIIFVLGCLRAVWKFHPGRCVNHDLTPVVGCLAVLVIVLCTAPTVHFWNAAWLLPLLSLRPCLSGWLFSGTIAFCFTAFALQGAVGQWEYPVWAHLLVWGPPLCILFLEKWPGRANFENLPRKTCVSVSVIVPTKNEAGWLGESLEALQKNEEVEEIIVVDAGSNDATLKIAEQFGVRVMNHSLPPEKGGGRGGQIKAGVDVANGDVLMIVHADTIVPPDTAQKVLEVLNNNPDRPGGAVGSVFAGSGFHLRLLELANNFRASLLGLSFGDQVQFFRNDQHKIFPLFPDVPLMEDVEFSVRLAARGYSLFLWGDCLVSPRQWQKQGSTRSLLIMRLVGEYLFRRLFGEIDTANWYYTYYEDAKKRDPSK